MTFEADDFCVTVSFLNAVTGVRSPRPPPHAGAARSRTWRTGPETRPAEALPG
jgi:hypothetical protein